MRVSHHLAAVGLTLTTMLGSPAAAPETVMVDGVPQVRNGTTPRNCVVTLGLEELWRIGGAGIEHGGLCWTFSAFTAGDILLVAGFLTRFDATGIEIARFCETVNDIDLTKVTFDEKRHMAPNWWNHAVGRDGRVYVAPYLYMQRGL